MALATTDKGKLIQKHAQHDKDSGSPEVQIALFSEEIKRLTKHLTQHKKDHSSRRGILRMVSKRKRLLDYLRRESPGRYDTVVRKLKLKR